MIKILGIDPGSRFLGYGLLQVERDRIVYLHHGVLNLTKEESFSARIHKLGYKLAEILKECKPEVVVLENVFLGKNADSAFKLGHARGVCMYEAKCAGADIREYSTRLVKKAVTGTGAADKWQVQTALRRLLPAMNGDTSHDASDALALAYHQAIQMEVERKLLHMTNLGVEK